MPDFRNPGKEGAVERGDIHLRSVLWVAGAILITLVLVPAACWGLMKLWHMPPGAGPNQPRDFRTEAPRLQAAPQEEKEAYFDQKEKQLHGYAWINRETGIVRIPVEVAMDMMVARAGKGGGRP